MFDLKVNKFHQAWLNLPLQSNCFGLNWTPAQPSLLTFLSIISMKGHFLTYKKTDNVCRNWQQAGAELGHAQFKLGLDFTLIFHRFGFIELAGWIWVWKFDWKDLVWYIWFLGSVPASICDFVCRWVREYVSGQPIF